MKTYKIEINEQKSKVIDILANSPEEALQIADNYYREGEITLSDDDVYETFEINLI